MKEFVENSTNNKAAACRAPVSNEAVESDIATK
jgi:hypothetical protein